MRHKRLDTGQVGAEDREGGCLDSRGAVLVLAPGERLDGTPAILTWPSLDDNPAVVFYIAIILRVRK
jgi:hypothetical protein